MMLTARRLALAVAVVIALAVLARGLLIGMHWLMGRGVLGTRVMAIFYMICDVSVVSSMLLLLITRERRPPIWLERRLPNSGRWLWPFLLCLTILAYVSLAPTFLYLYIHFRKR
jgi:hypothetical protein